MRLRLVLLFLEFMSEMLAAGEKRILKRRAFQLKNTGKAVKPHSAPWQAFLQIKGKLANYKFCGGVLISKQHLITTAKCCEDATSVNVILGGYNLNAQEDSQKIVDSDHLYIHPNWKYPHYDLCIVSLRQHINFTLSKGISSVGLPSMTQRGDFFTGKEGNVTSYFDDNTSVILRGTTVKIVSQSECARHLGDKGYEVPKGAMCTNTTSDMEFCMGADGSPLISRDKTGNICLAGVSLALKEACNEFEVGLAANITFYREWISRRTGVKL